MDGFFATGGAAGEPAITALGEDWRKARETPSAQLWIRAGTAVRDMAQGWIVGELFTRGAGRPAPSAPPGLQDARASVEAVCARLVADYWGRYVAIFPAAPALLRDPSGHLDCLAWGDEHAWRASSTLPSTLSPAQLPPGFGVDWAAVAALVAGRTGAEARLALAGVEPVLAGALKTFGRGPDRLVWNPAAYANRPHPSYAASRDSVIAAVTESLTAEAAAGEGLLVEISGGLDSAIVASTVAKVARPAQAAFVHLHVPDAAGDERTYARALADHAGLVLAEIAKPELTLDAASLAALPVGPRVSVNALDRHADEALAQAAVQHRARRLLTGQGGDMVFFQSASPKLAAELWGPWARRPRTDPVLRQLEAIARWNRRSVWSVLGEAAREAWRAPRPDPSDHPWLAIPVAPAKARQLRSLIRAQVFHGDSTRGRRAQLVHPLLHQPVLEATLSAPALDLARGGVGRALAREAFAAQIPDLVRARRSKGDLTAYYGRMVLRSLPTLEAFLIEGRLAQERVVDRAAVEAMLDPDRLIHQGDYPRLFELIALEAFVRHWEGRSSRPAAGGVRKRSASHGRTSA